MLRHPRLRTPRAAEVLLGAPSGGLGSPGLVIASAVRLTATVASARSGRAKEWLAPRAHLLTNKARLDRVLTLMQLKLDGLARGRLRPPNPRRLSARHGIAARRRMVEDPAEALGLHDGIRPAPWPVSVSRYSERNMTNLSRLRPSSTDVVFPHTAKPAAS